MASLTIFSFFFLLLCFLTTDASGEKDSCRKMEFRTALAFKGKRLINHLIRVVELLVEGSCGALCYMEPHCVSYNMAVSNGSPSVTKCELNNSTHNEHPDDFKPWKNFTYRGTVNTCGQTPCQNNGTCLTGFTEKRYKCVCLPGYNGKDCEKAVGWTQMEPSTVCFGSKGNSFGAFRIPIAGGIITFKLTYLYGHVSCYGLDPLFLSRWGCPSPHLLPNQMATYVTDDQQNPLLPKSEHRAGHCEGRFYSLPWVTRESPELLFDNFSTPLTVSANQEFQIWYNEDLFKCGQTDNGIEKTCAAVYGLYV